MPFTGMRTSYREDGNQLLWLYFINVIFYFTCLIYSFHAARLGFKPRGAHHKASVLKARVLYSLCKLPVLRRDVEENEAGTKPVL